MDAAYHIPCPAFKSTGWKIDIPDLSTQLYHQAFALVEDHINGIGTKHIQSRRREEDNPYNNAIIAVRNGWAGKASEDQAVFVWVDRRYWHEPSSVIRLYQIGNDPDSWARAKQLVINCGFERKSHDRK